jgi:hypothetical protein
MSKSQLISAEAFCQHHELEFSFVSSLHDLGLIEVTTVKQMAFLNSEELPKLEQIVRFNSELEINLEGIQVILALLDRVQKKQYEVTQLKSRLRLYEDD